MVFARPVLSGNGVKDKIHCTATELDTNTPSNPDFEVSGKSLVCLSVPFQPDMRCNLHITSPDQTET